MTRMLKPTETTLVIILWVEREAVDDIPKNSCCLWHDIEAASKIARLGFDVERSNSCDVEAHWTRLP